MKVIYPISSEEKYFTIDDLPPGQAFTFCKGGGSIYMLTQRTDRLSTELISNRVIVSLDNGILSWEGRTRQVFPVNAEVHVK
jgi:hypothetical protein